MGKITGFMEYGREVADKRPASERIKDYREFELPVQQEELTRQGARCMDCGVPFCNTGCPLGNLIPDFNDHVYAGRDEDAANALHSTNNFPEFTGRVCPAPCEAACVLNINDDPVSIKLVEKSIAETAWEQGMIEPRPARQRTDKSVAIVGSGPAGLATAQQLARAGHSVTVFERDDRLGGLLNYGIPDFKLEKTLIERRVEQMRQEGVEFQVGVHIGRDISADDLRSRFDAVCLAAGSRVPRDLPVPGRDLSGVHFAMEFLEQQNRRVAGDTVPEESAILATGKHVVVVGGGDTGSDCIGTSHRQGAKSVTNIELMPKPPDALDPSPWPLWPSTLRTSSSHDEGGDRDWAVSSKRLSGEDGRVTQLHCVRVRFEGRKLIELPDSEFALDADLVLLAMGFVHPEKAGLLEQLGAELTPRGNVAVDPSMMTSVPGVFAAGDVQRGQSLVVWAIADGRRAARGIDAYLTGHSHLAVPGVAGTFR